MRFRRRSSTLPRSPWPRGIERTEPLRGQLWTRSERALREPDVAWGWRALGLVAAVLEVAILGWLWFGPALGVHSVDVAGARHMTPAQVAAAAGLSGRSSVISIDAQSARAHLLQQVWVRTAIVEPRLPGSVVITVGEWDPVALYHAGPSTNRFLLSSQSVVLGRATAPAALVDVQGPAGADPHVGDRPLDSQLLAAMINIQRAMPALVGQDVAGFVFDSCGDMTLIAKRGWKVYFGRVLTPEEFASLRDKLTALKAIAGNGNVNYASPDLEYVNVMNPAEPAVAYKSGEPRPAPSPSPGATPAPSPSPSPNPCR